MGKRILDMGKAMNFGPKSSYLSTPTLGNPYRIIFNWVIGVNKYKNDVDHKCCFWKFVDCARRLPEAVDNQYI
ncbi:unnamed protein product [Brassica oleracea]